MIEMKAICKKYRMGEVWIEVLKGIDLKIESGEFVAIMGPSGSGKSTLLNIAGCLDSPDHGSYTLGGVSVAKADGDMLSDIRNRKIGFVFQLFNLIPRINAARNVELPLVYAGVPPSERKKRAMKALELVGLEGRTGHTPAQLSGGQQQRVAIARALVNEPSVIIVDEPTGSLDTAAGSEIMKIFSLLHSTGKTIVMVTHEEEIAAYAKRVIRMRDGIIERDSKV